MSARVAEALTPAPRRPVPPELEAEDRDTDLLVARAKSGDQGAFTDLYKRYFDRVYAYLRVALNDESEAEDATQRVFLSVLEALPGYVRTDRPFRAWLFSVTRNRALDYARAGGRLFPEDPADLECRRDDAQTTIESHELSALSWTSDEDLIMLLERLPEAQRQAIVLRYVLGFDTAEIAEVMDRNTESVRQLTSRALRFLERRLAALGRSPSTIGRGGRRVAMRRLARSGPPRPSHSFSAL